MILALMLAATPVQDFVPIDFLIGHCWRGTLPNGDVDTHCFALTDATVTDHHEVVRAGTKIYWGDTLYAWQGGALRYTYTDMSGGVMKGSVSRNGDDMDFGTADYVGTDGARLTMTSHWVRLAPTAFEARITSPAGDHFNRTTRYTRVD